MTLRAATLRATAASVVCWRLDRLGRTARGLSTLFAGLLERGVGLVSLREGIDLSTPAGRLMAHVLASAAQYETELRAERVLAGQAAARAAGKRWGGSKKGRRVTVKPEQVDVVRRMHSEGAKVAAIARGCLPQSADSVCAASRAPLMGIASRLTAPAAS